MACTDCSQDGTSLNSQDSVYSTNCGQNECDQDAITVKYSGPNLLCSNILNGDNLETIITKLDTAVCSATGDYSTFNKYCLDDSSPITTQQQFVERISEYVCTFKSEYTTFTTVTFPNYQTTVNNRFLAIENPGITCTSAGVVDTDNIQSVLSKYCTKFSQIDASLNLSTVDWTQCFSVPVLPTTVAEAFITVESQICSLQSQISMGGGGTIPTFNNIGSCLDAPVTASDTLVSTVNKIKSKLCTLPSFDTTPLSSSCVSLPASYTSTGFRQLIQNIITSVDGLNVKSPTFGAGFAVANVDNAQPCLGKVVTLAAGPVTDKFVSLNSGDLTPGYLADKLQAGTNVTFDLLANPGKITINNSGGAVVDEKVLAFTGDSTGGKYLDQKIVAGLGANGISLSFTNDNINGQVVVTPVLNMATLVNAIITTLSENSELFQLWCNLNASCPSPCAPPSNITVTYLGTTTTTTSTSTSSTSTTTSTTTTT